MKAGLRLSIAYMQAAFAWDNEVWDLGESALIGLFTGGLGARACFPAGTLIAMADGTFKPIESIETGDFVVCDRDPEVVGTEAGLVVDTMHRQVREIVELDISIGDDVLTVQCTPDHPFYVPDRAAYLSASQLQSSECVLTSKGVASVVAARVISEPVTVFNFHVHEAENYFVSDRAHGPFVLVHNNKCLRAVQVTKKIAQYGIKSYRTLRKLVAGKGFRVHHLIEKRFARLFGQNQDEMLSIVVTVGEHQDFTNAWRNRFPYGSGTVAATKQEVIAVAKEVYKDYPVILQARGLQK